MEIKTLEIDEKIYYYVNEYTFEFGTFYTAIAKPNIAKYIGINNEIENPLQDINETHGVGQIKVAGEVWSAKTSDGSVIEKGTQIEVIQIDGVKAVVEPTVIATNIFVK